MLIGIGAYTASRAGLPGATIPSFDGAAAFGFYILTYLLGTIGVFAGILALRKDGREIREIQDLLGGAWANDLQSRLVAWAMVICLVSLAGVPPLAGFWGKLLVFGSALSVPPAQAEAFGIFVGLTVLAAINTAIGAAYYLRVVAALVFAPRAERLQPSQAAGPHIAAWACAIITIGVGLWWQPWVHWSYAASPLGPVTRTTAFGRSLENGEHTCLNPGCFSEPLSKGNSPFGFSANSSETSSGLGRIRALGSKEAQQLSALRTEAFVPGYNEIWDGELLESSRFNVKRVRCEKTSNLAGQFVGAQNNCLLDPIGGAGWRILASHE
jgi:hypothetical protein